MAYLTVAEVAERLRVYPGTVKRWLREGKLVGVQLGDRAGWRIEEEDLEAFLERQKNVSASADDEETEGKAAA
jgi:excisionase family DNA binding protein